MRPKIILILAALLIFGIATIYFAAKPTPIQIKLEKCQAARTEQECNKIKFLSNYLIGDSACGWENACKGIDCGFDIEGKDYQLQCVPKDMFPTSPYYHQ